jgi:hypothetical protein
LSLTLPDDPRVTEVALTWVVVKLVVGDVVVVVVGVVVVVVEVVDVVDVVDVVEVVDVVVVDVEVVVVDVDVVVVVWGANVMSAAALSPDWSP